MAVAPSTTHPLRGILAMVAGTALFACGDVFAKMLTPELPPLMIAWMRYIVFAVLILGFLLATRGVQGFASRRPGLQIVRGLGMLGSAVFFMSGIVFLPVADATAIFFILPILLTAFAVVFLHEVVGWRRWAAAVIGFCGVLIVMRPGTDAFRIASLFPVLAATSWAIAGTITRYVSARDAPVTTLAWSALVGFVIASFAVPFFWVAPQADQLWVALAMGLVSSAGHGLVVLALRDASASLVAPYAYGQIVWAGALAFIAFGTLPDRYTILGACVIAGAGIYISYRERRGGQAGA
ncbi:MAG: putative permease, DMT superfamily [Saliniramus fredricksonii]|uniref:Putative permease, DMT superfamily n=1 Tax=Saliniramus fredricksonii TaxID=1653334 RepID=A0A0P8BLZ0_9HYPH|nr:DMT family transporter [Saliniramus fredricksonii]KPQ10641.1 MAG: putative permease, DMT superfamily [Saliniramus fredricksonii]SCC79360.1 Threonine/homoserine efflux transporter RhtA [Saliniramus fredricksonii]